MLATRISFMNELANLADRLGADIEHVRQGIGADPRIGYHFLYPGVGYGGSCFPKDVKALRHTADEHHTPLRLLAAVEAVNDAQKSVLVDKIVARLGADLTGRRFALWGLAFKPNTDDMREAPSRAVIAALAQRGARVTAYDPVAMDEARRALGPLPHLDYASSREAACEGADALVVVTEWKEFRSPDFDALRRQLKHPLVFDGRNLYEPAVVRAAGLEYFAIGRRCAPPRRSSPNGASASRQRASSSSATSCSTATGSATSSAFRRRRPCPWCASRAPRNAPAARPTSPATWLRWAPTRRCCR
jgi:UDPglucose 6-dehydrogenase